MDRLRYELPGLAVQLARFRFGTDRPAATTSSRSSGSRRCWTRRPRRLLGVREGQLTVQYHGGGGVLAGEIGRLFTRRKDYPRQIKAVNLALKPCSTCAPRGRGTSSAAAQPLLHRRLPAGGPGQ